MGAPTLAGPIGQRLGEHASRDNGRLYIFLNSRNRLFALDARTGELFIVWKERRSSINDLPRISDDAHATQSSPPVVYKDLVILGSQVPDRVQVADPVGYVQAFNARTGKRVWAFSVIPQSAKDPGAETWENESWRANGHGNVWAPMALDEARSLLYLPTSTPSSDYYGGQRPGANLFAESLVCLDASNGKMKWYFQTVHHGLWDWDLPAQPNLVTINVNGQRIDAVAQVTKRGETFVFDRVTGSPSGRSSNVRLQPIAMCRERNLSDATFPHQASRLRQPGRYADDANNLTPEIRAMAQAEMQSFDRSVHPPSLRGTLQRPSQGGGEASGAAFDPETGYLFVRPQTNRRESAREEHRRQQTRAGRLFKCVRIGGKGSTCQAGCRWCRRHGRS
jgi:quinoprotein glucose dehydrogenase